MTLLAAARGDGTGLVSPAVVGGFTGAALDVLISVLAGLWSGVIVGVIVGALVGAFSSRHGHALVEGMIGGSLVLLSAFCWV